MPVQIGSSRGLPKITLLSCVYILRTRKAWKTVLHDGSCCDFVYATPAIRLLHNLTFLQIPRIITTTKPIASILMSHFPSTFFCSTAITGKFTVNMDEMILEMMAFDSSNPDKLWAHVGYLR